MVRNSIDLQKSIVVGTSRLDQFKRGGVPNFAILVSIRQLAGPAIFRGSYAVECILA